MDLILKLHCDMTTEHRRQPSKGTGYEEDIRVPFLVRGPGVNKGHQASTHSVPDISATIAHLAGAESSADIDGKVMPWGSAGASDKMKGTSNHQIAEFWVRGPRKRHLAIWIHGRMVGT